VEQDTQEHLDLQVRTVHRATQDTSVPLEQLDLLGAREDKELLDHVEELE